MGLVQVQPWEGRGPIMGPSSPGSPKWPGGYSSCVIFLPRSFVAAMHGRLSLFISTPASALSSLTQVFPLPKISFSEILAWHLFLGGPD